MPTTNIVQFANLLGLVGVVTCIVSLQYCSGSGLASIFGGGGRDSNASLTYTAPKQPKKSSKSKYSVCPQILKIAAI